MIKVKGYSEYFLSLLLIDLHSQLDLIAAQRESLRDCHPEKIMEKIQTLRKAIPPNSLLGDISSWHKKWATETDGYPCDNYWIHGLIPAKEYLTALEKGFNRLKRGERDFRRPMRELNEKFPYNTIRKG